MTRRLRFLGVAICLALALSGSVDAYYHYVRFGGSAAAPFRLVEKFDLGALVDRRVLFFVSRAQRPQLTANDSFEAVLSQVRQALDVWDAAPSSALRVGFGGLVEEEIAGSSPAGLIVFDELPPGVLGFGGPVVHGQPQDGFLPILRSQVVLSSDLAGGERPRTSYSELFFSTLVHEIGHGLGLQHTLASSAMSRDATRATTRARPLAADDIAGLSALYPAAGFQAETAAIAGRVTFEGGSPAALSSVAAVHPSGTVVTALTDPDGSYRLEGLLPGEHLLYVQPLPPPTIEGLGPENIILPLQADGSPAAASGPFSAQFFGGGTQPEQAPRVTAQAGATVAGIDFTVTSRSDLPLHSVTTYSFPGNGAPGVHPAFLNLTRDSGFILATGAGVTERIEELEIQTLDRMVRVEDPVLYQRDSRFVEIGFDAAPFTSFGPIHLLFRAPDDFHILPAAVQLADRPAPIIHWLTPDFAFGGDAWRLRGDDFDPRAKAYFDGQAAEVLQFDELLGEIVVRPPSAPPGHRAVVTVYNPDGQSSAFTLPDGNVIFEYPEGRPATVRVSADVVEPNSDFVLTIEADGFPLEEPLGVGFGSSDLITRAVEVVAPDRALAIVTARATAAPGDYAATVSSGLHAHYIPGAIAVGTSASFSGLRPRLRFGGLVNSATGAPDVSPGALASLNGENLLIGEADENRISVTFDGLPARLLSAAQNRINLQIPEELSPGIVELRVFNGEAESPPLPVWLDRVSPGLFEAVSTDGAPVTADAPVPSGAIVDLLATGLGSAGVQLAESAAAPLLRILFAGARLTATEVQPISGAPGLFRVRFQIPPQPGSGLRDVALLVDGRRSNSLQLYLAGS